MKKIFLALALMFLFAGNASAYNLALDGTNGMSNCAVWDASTVAVDTDWLASDCESGNPTHPVRHTIEISCPTSTIVEIDITRNSVEKTVEVNSGTALDAAAVYQFGIILAPGDSWNIQHKTGTQNCSLDGWESSDISL